ncbi:MAG: sigma-70 family RNA polymerase sigma factor [Bdellovibrionales bacterium]|nr:sigma-70 family RNA polymerase sigma factor [Bdellovibrionales bacterium]
MTQLAQAPVSATLDLLSESLPAIERDTVATPTFHPEPAAQDVPFDQFLSALQSGSGYERLVQDYGPFIDGAIRRAGIRCEADLDDVRQDTFVKISGAVGRFSGHESQFYGWIGKIARNTALTLLKKQSTERKHIVAAGSISSEDPESVLEKGYSRDVRVATGERISEGERHAISTVLEFLKPVSRDVLVAYCARDMKYREIAACFGVPLGTVMSRLHRARSEVRTILEELYGVAA